MKKERKKRMQGENVGWKTVCMVGGDDISDTAQHLSYEKGLNIVSIIARTMPINIL